MQIQRTALHDRVLELVQAHNDYGPNEILRTMSLSECERIDKMSASDQFVEKCRREILGLLAKYTVGYSENLVNAYNAFVECCVYLDIQQQGINLIRVPESKVSTPDFKVEDTDPECFIEVKALGWAQGGNLHRELMEDGVEKRIDQLDQIEAGANLAISEFEMSPLGSTRESIANPIKHYIEAVIDKLDQNIKRKQYDSGPTFLLCDLSTLHHPSDAYSASIVVQTRPFHCSYSSGELWYIAFGQVGDLLLTNIEFEGKPNAMGRLERNGILTEHDYIAGIIFRCSGLDNVRSYTALIRSEDQDEHLEVVSRISSFWNDDTNSNAWRLIGNCAN